ncbi:MAG TPA: multidrug MFS transporter [Rhodobacteraceae bacterium]|nr:multidrug MFS transporter [Paracoccaceae bacterium]
MRISTPEFISLMAMLVATVAISIDAMLPALPDIAIQLTAKNPNQVQLILSAFIGGMALGTLVVGPLSDSFGRKNIIYVGAVIYISFSALCMFATDLETIVIARVFQGIGAAAPRVVSQALVRDLYSGREMARITSFIMIIFSIAPAVAPLLGAGLISLFDWRAIFLIFIIFALISTIWTKIRIREPLRPEMRVPFQIKIFHAAFLEIISIGIVRVSIITLIFSYGTLFTCILLVQQVFDQFFGRANSFPEWFAVIAAFSASASFLNSMLVMKLGMRRLISAALRVQIALSAFMLLMFWTGAITGNLGFGFFVFWVFSLFFQAGLTFGNLTALAMEPLGHIAGTAASVISALATLGSVFLATIAGHFFDGTPVAMIISIALFASFGALSAHLLRRFERKS